MLLQTFVDTYIDIAMHEEPDPRSLTFVCVLCTLDRSTQTTNAALTPGRPPFKNRARNLWT
eukprot:COSAG06_NODE_2783_length_6290_cov_3.541916_7_plen_61_part_00